MTAARLLSIILPRRGRLDVRADPLLAPLERTPGGVRAGDCVLAEKLGQGGMGAVYLGRHTNLDIEVAVKILPFHVADTDTNAVARFRKEARATVRIDHPNIVRVFDVKEERGVHYLVMEYVDGESADARIKREGPLPERDALEIAIAAGEALAAAHAKGILHRDVKPANILIRFEDGRVKLADLGLAKALRGEGGVPTVVTGTGQMLGTPAFMSPEQATDASRVDERTDIYSLGATLYALLSGKAPFEETQLYKLLRKVVNESPPSLFELRPDVSRLTAAAATVLMTKNPKERPQTMKEALELLCGSFERAPTGGAQGLARPRMARRPKIKTNAEEIKPSPAHISERTLEDVTPDELARQRHATPAPEDAVPRESVSREDLIEKRVEAEQLRAAWKVESDEDDAFLLEVDRHIRVGRELEGDDPNAAHARFQRAIEALKQREDEASAHAERQRALPARKGHLIAFGQDGLTARKAYDDAEENLSRGEFAAAKERYRHAADLYKKDSIRGKGCLIIAIAIGLLVLGLCC